MKIILLSLLALCALAISAPAQTTLGPIMGGTNSVPASTTNTYASDTHTYTVANSVRVALAATFTMHSDAPGISNIVMVFDTAVDGAQWQLATHRFTAGASTNATTTITNLFLGGCAYLRLASIENENVVTATNIALTFSHKQKQRL